LKNDEPVYRYYKEEPSISFTNHEILLKAELCEAQRAAQESQTIFTPTEPEIGVSVQDKGIVQPGADGIVPLKPKMGLLSQPGFSQLQLNFTVPKGKVASLMGVLNFLQHRYNRIDISLHVEGGQLSDQEYEDKVKEAFRQMGIDI
jgi:hypothetical protein